MWDYIDLVQQVLLDGEERKQERTGVSTLAVFGGMLEFDLRVRFPLLQHKETKWQTAFKEMLWFLSGKCDNTAGLEAMGSKLWNPWADEYGRLGRVYGCQWRGWQTRQNVQTPDKDGHIWYLPQVIDQIRQVIHLVKTNPQSRRLLVSAWNVADLDCMALPPCHWAHQLYVSNDGHLDMMVHQRSWDLALGAPFNIAQYALLQHLYARATGLTPRMLKFTYGDAHIYSNHVEAMNIMDNAWMAHGLEEDACKLVINTDNVDIDGYKWEDFAIEGYRHGPHIPLPVAV